MNIDTKKSMDEVAAFSLPNQLEADLSAAGFTDEAIAEYMQVTAAQAPSIAWSATEDRDRQGNAPTSTLEPYTPTYRENLSKNVTAGAKALGLPYPERYGEDVSGIADFTPLGIPFGIQEGARQVQRAWNAGDKTDVALGALNVGLSVVSAIPVTKAAAKAVNSLAKKAVDAYDPNTLNIFAGKMAKNFPHIEEGEAARMADAGFTDKEIWMKTGLQYMPDGRAVFQIDPAGAKFRNYENTKKVYEKGLSSEPNTSFSTRLLTQFDFPELYSNYPKFKELNLTVSTDPDVAKGGYFSAADKAVVVGYEVFQNPDKLREVVIHELQHGVQAVEGTVGGAAPSYFFKLKEDTGKYVSGAADMQDDINEINSLKDLVDNQTETYFAAHDPSTRDLYTDSDRREITKQLQKSQKDLVAKSKELTALAYAKYHTNEGEIEARAASLWDKLTPEQRATTTPSEVYKEALGQYELKYGDTYMPVGRLPVASVGPDGSLVFTKEPYKPKLFSSRKDGKLEVNPEALMDFYSPVVDTIKNTEFPSKGYKGSELMKLLQTKTPGVRKAELDAMDLGIDPQKRYTKEDVLALTDKKAYKVSAIEVDDTVYGDIQRQLIEDPQVSQTTIKINATREEDSTFLPSTGYTHYDPNTIAHTRVSIRENAQGQKYLLVEEMQSDLVQKKPAEPRGPLSLDQAYEEVLGQRSKEIVGNNPERIAAYQAHQDFYDTAFKVTSEQGRIFELEARGIKVPQEEIDNLAKMVQDAQAKIDDFQRAEEANVSPRVTSELFKAFEDAGFRESDRIDLRKSGVSKAPITEDSDAVRLSLQAAMAKASQEDATSIVIPNVQRIVSAGRARVGSEEYEKYMKAGSGFQRTYVDSVEKFIKQLREEYGDAIRVDVVELPYTQKKATYQGQEIPLSNTAIRIDFGDIKGTDFRVGRFYEGGDVTSNNETANSYAVGGSVEDKQMKTIMQEGGIATPEVDRESVTGNEVPPGSLPSEVRDNLPTQLSEGEYVVPADVVRFFGVKFFEDLRSQAKQGLAEMDANGRIGGVPVDAGGVPADQGEELTPEEEQMLQQALGAKSGMAEGGDTAAFDRTQFSLGTGYTGIESKKYINPTTKEVKEVPFIGTTPLGIVPVGFVPWTAELEAQDTPPVPDAEQTKPKKNNITYAAAPTAPTGAVAPQGSSAASEWAKQNYEALSTNPYQFGIDSLNDTTGKNLSMGLSAVGIATMNPLPALAGSVVKSYNKVENVASANAALQVMASQGKSNTPEYKALEEAVNTYVSNLSPMEQAGINMGVMGSGDRYYKSYEELSKSPEALTATPPKPTPTQTGGGNVTYATPAAPAPAPAPAGTTPTQVQTPAGTKTVSNTAPAPAKTYAAPTTEELRAQQATTQDYQNRASAMSGGAKVGLGKGGLVTKPRKKR